MSSRLSTMGFHLGLTVPRILIVRAGRPRWACFPLVQYIYNLLLHRLYVSIKAHMRAHVHPMSVAWALLPCGGVPYPVPLPPARGARRSQSPGAWCIRECRMSAKVPDGLAGWLWLAGKKGKRQAGPERIPRREFSPKRTADRAENKAALRPSTYGTDRARLTGSATGPPPSSRLEARRAEEALVLARREGFPSPPLPLGVRRHRPLLGGDACMRDLSTRRGVVVWCGWCGRYMHRQHMLW